MDTNRAFRDYVTRVSFNLSMSRNQVATLRSVVLDIEGWDATLPWDKCHPGMDERREQIRAARAEGFHVADMFIPGIRFLLSTGLVQRTAAYEKAHREDNEEKEKYGRLRGDARIWRHPPWELTPAGVHVVGLLRIAGLIPMAAANSNKPAKRKRRA